MSVKKYLDIVGLEHLLDYLPTFKIKVTCDAEFATETITCTNNIKTYSAECPSTSPYVLTFTVNAPGTWTISGTDSVSGETYSVDVTVTTLGMVETELQVINTPEGATVTPTDDIQTWLKCANLEKSYTTLAEVLADAETYETLLADSNACDYMVRSTTWAGDPTVRVPKMTSNTAPSGEAFASSTYSSSYPAYYAFDGNDTTFWSSQSSGNQYVGYKFTSAVNINKLYIYPNLNSGTDYEFKLQGSNDNSDWTDLKTFEIDGLTPTYIDVDSNESYMYYRVFRDNGWQAFTIQFYHSGITTSETTMRLLGKYDYACQKLLSDSTWMNAIRNSDYFEYVLVDTNPLMTSDTTPRGTASCSSYSTASSITWAAYKAFDNQTNTTQGWRPSTNNAVNQWVTYDFGYSFKAYSFRVHIRETNGSTITFKIHGSSNNSDWTELTDNVTVNNNTFYYLPLNNIASYRYYRLTVLGLGSSANGYYTVEEIRYFGREKLVNDYIPSVPKMTSNTTPAGEAFADSEYATNYQAWKAFDKDLTAGVGWVSNTGGYPHYLGYDFINPIEINRVIFNNIPGNLAYAVKVYKIQGSNESKTAGYVDLTDDLVNSNADYSDVIVNLQNTTKYRYYRIYVSDGYNGVRCDIGELQFYSKLDKTIIHSAPLDTIYYKNSGTDIPICTTDANGIGEIDLSGFFDGTYTLYSSVAKDPSNLSNDYSKAIRITKSPFGESKELYLMPSNTLYWWGYEASDLEDLSTSNGWELVSTNYAFASPTRYTNYIYLNCSTTTKVCGVGKSKITSKDILNNIKAVYQTKMNLSGKNVKMAQVDQNYSDIGSSSNIDLLTVGEATEDKYIFVDIYSESTSASIGSGSLYAFWYE